MSGIRYALEFLLRKSIESKILNTSNTVLLLFISQLLLYLVLDTATIYQFRIQHPRLNSSE